MMKVAYVCVHNSCRSQMAEAITKHLASDTLEAYSAGTEIAPEINSQAVRLIKDRYGVDMTLTQRSKLIAELPKVDIVITMGCNVNCPYLPCKFREDWGLADPSGKSDEEFNKTIDIIERKVLELRKKFKN